VKLQPINQSSMLQLLLLLMVMLLCCYCLPTLVSATQVVH